MALDSGVILGGGMLLVLVGFLGGIGIQLLEGAGSAAYTLNNTTQAVGFIQKAISGITQLGQWLQLSGTTIAAVFIMSLVGLLMVVFNRPTGGMSS